MSKSTYVYVPKIAKLKLFQDMYIWGKTEESKRMINSKFNMSTGYYF